MQSKPRTAWICLLLAVSVITVYWPARNHNFIHCDDPDYVTNNLQTQAGLTWHGLRWAFTTDRGNNWHPLTWLSHMLDCQLFGLKPGWHHITSVLLHILNTLLLFVVVRKMTGATWRSAFVAALFGLHPLHVESVAWVAERKDVLSAFFFMLTLGAYAAYAKQREAQKEAEQENAKSGKQKTQNRTAILWYGLTLFVFALGLMSKPILVSVPFVLLLLDFWPLRRLRLSNLNSPGVPKRGHGGPGITANALPLTPQISGLPSLLLEKLPFLALSAASCVVTLIVQGHEGNVASMSAFPIELRIENALLSYAFYLKMMFWPAGLAAYYPYSKEIPIEALVGATITLVVISVAAFALPRRRPYLAVGWLWYLGMLVPVIGLVQVGLQARADRYTYLPLIGLFIGITWGVCELTKGVPLRRALLATTATVVLGGCSLLTTMQVRLWKNSETLYQHALEVTSDNAAAHMNLGTALAQRGKMGEAAQHFAEAVRIRPSYAEAQSNLGATLAAQGKNAEAIALYRSALALRPWVEQTHFLLGSALSVEGNRDEAIAEYRTALQINPDHILALNDLAWLLATDARAEKRDGAEAAQLAERLCRLTAYRHAQFVGTLAATYAEEGRFDEAVTNAEKAATLAEAAGQKSLAERNRQLKELYEARKAFHETGESGRQIE